MKKPSFTWNPQYHKVLDPRVSLIKSESANTHPGTYFDQNGILRYAKYMTPRHDHNPVSGDSIGVLIESAATNLCPYSKDVYTNWTNNSSFVSATANADYSPDGTNNATLIYDNNVGASVRTWMPSSNITLLSSTIYTVSCMVKPAGRSLIWLTLSDSTGNSNGFGAKFNITTKTLISSTGFGSGSVIHSTIRELSNGWVFISVSGVNPTTTARPKIVFIDNNGDTQTSPSTGSVGSGIFVFGMQITQSSRPLSYIPTTSAQAITRPADVFAMTRSDILNQSQGTILVVFEKQFTQPSSDISFVCSLNNGSSSSAYGIRIENSTTIKLLRNTGSSLQSTVSESQRYAVAMTYNQSQLKAFFNNGEVLQTSTSGTSTINQLTIGCNEFKTGDFLNGHLSFISYYPYNLTDSELKLL